MRSGAAVNLQTLSLPSGFSLLSESLKNFRQIYFKKAQKLKRFNSWRVDCGFPPPTSPSFSSKATSSDDNLWRHPPSLGHLSPWCVTIFKDEWPGKRMKHIEVQTLPWTNGSHHCKKALFSFLSRPGTLCWKDNAYFIDFRGERWTGRAENNWNQDIQSACFWRRNKTDEQTHRKRNSSRRMKN